MRALPQKDNETTQQDKVMQNYYFVTGAWGVKSGSGTILAHWSNVLTSNFEGSPENEAESIHSAIKQMEDKSFKDLESDLTQYGLTKGDCAWQYLNLCPLKK